MKDLLMFLFTKLVIRVKNKIILSLAFIVASAFLSAFLDALTKRVKMNLRFISTCHPMGT